MIRLFEPRVRSILFASWCFAWLVVAALLLAPLSNPVTVSYSDLIGHFLVFAGLAFGAVGFSHRGRELTLLAVLTMAGGIALELAQGLVPYRTLDILDACANALGAMTGYGGALTVLYLLIRPAAEAHRASRTAGA